MASASDPKLSPMGGAVSYRPLEQLDQCRSPCEHNQNDREDQHLGNFHMMSRSSNGRPNRASSLRFSFASGEAVSLTTAVSPQAM